MMEIQNRLSEEKYYTGNIDLFTIPDLGQLSYEITGQVLKNRKFEESFIKLKNNLGEILTNIKFREEIQDAEFILKQIAILPDGKNRRTGLYRNT